MMNETKTSISTIWEAVRITKNALRNEHDANVMCLCMLMLRRVDCMLTSYNVKVRNTYKKLAGSVTDDSMEEELITAANNQGFYNKSIYDFESLSADIANLHFNFNIYIDGFNNSVLHILNALQFDRILSRFNKERNDFYVLFDMFHSLNLSSKEVDEEILTACREMCAAIGGYETFQNDNTDVLIAELLAAGARKKSASIFDPACGSAQTLLASGYYAKCDEVYGMDLNPESVALARMNVIMEGRGHDLNNIRQEDSLSFEFKDKFDYIVSVPPFGPMRRGRESFNLFDDYSDAFARQILYNLKDEGRAVFSVSAHTLFNDSYPCRHFRMDLVIKDMLEAIIWLHEPFRNTFRKDLYILVVDKNKRKERKGKLQFIDALTNDWDVVLSEYNNFQNNDYSSIVDILSLGRMDMNVKVLNGKLPSGVPNNVSIPAAEATKADRYFRMNFVDKYGVDAELDYSEIQFFTDFSFPMKMEAKQHRTPSQIMDEIKELTIKISTIRDSVQTMLGGDATMASEPPVNGSRTCKMGDIIATRRKAENFDFALPLLKPSLDKNLNKYTFVIDDKTVDPRFRVHGAKVLRIHKGDVLLIRSLTAAGTMMVYKGDDAVVSNAFECFSVDDCVQPEYLALLSRTEEYKTLIESMTRVTTIKSVRISAFFEMKVTIPPLEDQKRMIELDEKCEVMERCSQRQSELMEEYRQSVMEYSINSK